MRFFTYFNVATMVMGSALGLTMDTSAMGEYLGQVPVDFSGKIQVPKAELNVTVTYLRDGTMYARYGEVAYDDGAVRSVHRGSCWGISIGACCIGVYCEAKKARGIDAPTTYDVLELEGDVEGSSLAALTIHPDYSVDMIFDSPGEEKKLMARYTCIGMHVSGCCLGLCIK